MIWGHGLLNSLGCHGRIPLGSTQLQREMRPFRKRLAAVVGTEAKPLKQRGQRERGQMLRLVLHISPYTRWRQSGKMWWLNNGRYSERGASEDQMKCSLHLQVVLQNRNCVISTLEVETV